MKTRADVAPAETEPTMAERRKQASQQSDFAPQMVALLRERDVKAITGIDRTWRWRLIQEGKFPAAVRLGVRAVGWRSDEIQEWVNQRDRKARRAA